MRRTVCRDSGDASHVLVARRLTLRPSTTPREVGSTSVGCNSFLGCYMVVDTGTSVIAGPPSAMDKLIAAVGKVEQDCSNVDKLPTVSRSPELLWLTVRPHEALEVT